MSSAAKSRWQDDTADVKADAQRKLQKQAKKRAKAEKQRQTTTLEEEIGHTELRGDLEPALKKCKVSASSPNGTIDSNLTLKPKLLRFPTASWGPCRHVDNFEKLNNIEEGSYGWVSRARELATGEVVALKRLKLDNSGDGFPVTGLREIQTLQSSRHENVIALKEVVVGGESLKE